MPFQYTLANLLAENEGALGVLFLDETGETVDLACAEYTRDANPVNCGNWLARQFLLSMCPSCFLR